MRESRVDWSQFFVVLRELAMLVEVMSDGSLTDASY